MELLEGAGSARLVDVDNPAALAHEITILIDAPDLRRTLGARGETFVRDYDWSTIAARLESIYLTTLSHS